MVILGHDILALPRNFGGITPRVVPSFFLRLFEINSILCAHTVLRVNKISQVAMKKIDKSNHLEDSGLKITENREIKSGILVN